MNVGCHLGRARRGKAGQTLVLYAIMALALVLAVGACVDGATIYLSKAALDKAVDAAALTAVRNLFQGESQASTVAQSALAANYRGGGWNAEGPYVNVSYTADENNNKIVNILSTTTIRTYFMRIVPRFRTFTISSAASATRAKLIMSIVLDRSGSMVGNNGSQKLPGAVSSFVNYFDDNMDMVSLVSFSSTTNLNVSVRKPFKSAVTSAVNSMTFAGATYSEGGLKLALAQNQSVPVVPGDNTVKLVLFFTDGLANTFQGTWPTNKTYNVGGFDSGATYAILNPSNGNQLPNSSTTYSGPSPAYCPTMVNFLSVDGMTKTVNGANFRAEGQLRALSTANNIRDAGMLIYCIGLGGGNVDASFLNEIANDNSSATFNPNQPVGEAVIAPSANDLQTVFQQIAARILLRLTR